MNRLSRRRGEVAHTESCNAKCAEAMAAAAASSSAGEALAVATDSIISKASMDSAMDWFMNPNPPLDSRKRKAV